MEKALFCNSTISEGTTTLRARSRKNESGGRGPSRLQLSYRKEPESWPATLTVWLQEARFEQNTPDLA